MSEPFYDPADRPDECTREEFEAAMKIDDGGPAFPHSSQPLDPQGNPIMENHTEWGMSLRDYFAGMALQGLIARSPANAPAPVVVRKIIAGDCYLFADAMIAKRKEGA